MFETRNVSILKLTSDRESILFGKLSTEYFYELAFKYKEDVLLFILSDLKKIINENNILNDNKKWSSYSINNVLNNNSNYINNLEKLTNDLLIEIYKKLNNNNVNLNYDYIFKLLTQIHYHNMSDSILNLKNILNENILSKKYIWDDFLNKYNINFRIWNYEKEVTKYGYNNI